MHKKNFVMIQSAFIKEYLMQSKFFIYILIPICLLLSSCNANSASSCCIEGAELNLIVPDSYPTQSSQIVAYGVIRNDLPKTINIMNFIISNNTTGVKVVIDNKSCKQVGANSSCMFPINIAANQSAGSFKITIKALANNGKDNQFISWVKSLVGSGDLRTLSAVIGLVNLFPNINDGAAGISFLYSPIIVASTNSRTQLMSVAVVNSPYADKLGPFNTINLSDRDGKILQSTVLSGNSGAGAPILNQGSIVTLLYSLPSSNKNFEFYGQIAQTTKHVGVGNQSSLVKIVSQSTSPNIITLEDAHANMGVLSGSPSIFVLNSQHKSQVIHYINIGNGPVLNFNVAASAPLIPGETTCNSSLDIGKSCEYTVLLDPEHTESGVVNLVASYNNGKSQIPLLTTIHFNDKTQ